MTQFRLAKRVATLPPYLFAEIDRLKAEVKAQGMDIISLGIGDPDLPTPDFIIEALYASAKKPKNHQYPSYTGLLSFRKAVADWYQTRFGVGLDPENEVVSLIGSKEGIAHFPLAFIDPGDLALIASPNYPVYPVATGFAGGEAKILPLTPENDFLPDLAAISDADWERAKVFFVNYPNNPTAASAPREFYEKLVKKARETGTILVSDAAYTELYYDEAKRPLSILEIAGARDVAIEFHSLSKTYNMTGWRIGMAVGNESLVKGLGKIKENVDSGIFQAVQEAGVAALTHGEPHAASARAIYKERRDVAVAALGKMGIACRAPDATFYLWCRVPAGETSAGFVSRVLKNTGVVLTPGNGFGAPGEGFFRIALTVGKERLTEALSRIAAL
ncbi:LL-diaminopimelate aminotransferase [Desulfolutivibrio sulfoxidireducens]|uniref:LL-diaminopimelate aminotransferase n=1 Tax=Desulfolutivibrio sulfoxidireducens TaxID=2773299 RepID=UPI00159E1EC9|nr:LL-diaminopimelate aminotransferase [Desulfolutivibrio sulfoxidireducens]QLA16222.1 aminotransferase class I/II-fold pyridoxal phosphate-dependent enzyme [Desulfolutivibrio sulfoxidireducens]QLA19880.1 aminotransferase class I/II-fold pyridoxal phosphate-dependent enzyme [Desulfolutivibrio sulfoxidireducens]